MPARLLLDDALQSYTRDELRFLWSLAAELPGSVILRACHERRGQSSLLSFALDLRITSEVKVQSVSDNQEPALRRYQAMLRSQAQAALDDLRQLPSQEVRAGNCPRCGSLLPGTGVASRNAERRCEACGWTNVPERQKRG